MNPASTHVDRIAPPVVNAAVRTLMVSVGRL
jgi:hypothetical protein